MPKPVPVAGYRPGSVLTPSWWTQVWRILLLGGLAIWTAVAFWPRGTDAVLDDLVADLRSGEVTELQIADESVFGGLNVQFGIGFVLLLLLDAPWSRWASRRPEPLAHHVQVKLPGGDKRLTGGWAYLLVWLLGGFG